MLLKGSWVKMLAIFMSAVKKIYCYCSYLSLGRVFFKVFFPMNFASPKALLISVLSGPLNKQLYLGL